MNFRLRAAGNFGACYKYGNFDIIKVFNSTTAVASLIRFRIVNQSGDKAPECKYQGSGMISRIVDQIAAKYFHGKSSIRVSA